MTQGYWDGELDDIFEEFNEKNLTKYIKVILKDIKLFKKGDEIQVRNLEYNPEEKGDTTSYLGCDFQILNKLTNNITQGFCSGHGTTLGDPDSDSYYEEILDLSVEVDQN